MPLPFAILLLALMKQDVKPAPFAILTLDGKTFPIFEVSGGDMKADIVGVKIGPNKIEKKHLAAIGYEPIRFQLDLEGFNNLSPWINSMFSGGLVPKSGTISFRGKTLTFSNALPTLVSFPCNAPGDSGLIDFEIACEQIRFAAGPKASIQNPTPKPFTGSSCVVEGLGNPAIDSVLQRPTFTLTITPDQIGIFREPTMHPGKAEISDLLLSQSNAKKGGIADWVRPWFIDGKHLDGDEKNVKINYFRSGKPIFALGFTGCGLAKVVDFFNASDSILADLYTESVRIEAPAANAPAGKGAPETKDTNDSSPPSKDGKFGKYYQESSDKSVAVNVQSVTYSGERFAYGVTPQTSNIEILASDRKFVILNVQVKNFGTDEIRVGLERLHFTVEDETGVKVDGRNLAVRASDRLVYDAPLESGRTVELQYLCPISTLAAAKRIRVWGEDPALATEYDLTKNAVAPLAEELRSADDSTGAKMLETVEGKVGIWYPAGYSDVRIDGFSTISQSVFSNELDPANEIFVIKCRVRNASRGEWKLYPGTIRMVATDSQGKTYETRTPVSESLKSSGDRTFTPIGTTGAEATVAYAIQVPKGTKFTRLVFQEGGGHLFAIPVK